MTAEQVKTELNKHASATSAEFATRFFKAYDGGYSAHDKFLGLRVPLIRSIGKTYKDLPLDEIGKLLKSEIHEHRLAGLIILVNQFKKANELGREEIYKFYMSHLPGVNNWDLVDASCRDIVGGFLLDKPHDILYKLAQSKDLWERRIAVVSTYEFIRHGELDDTFKISEILMDDKHDLIHKAVGWMLREAGKKDRDALLEFLDKHAQKLPRTALRYSIEHLPPSQKLHYMKLKSVK